MPCYRIPNGIVCMGNEPVRVEYKGRSYYFEWHSYFGWMSCTKDGDERLSGVPEAVWDLLPEYTI